MAAVHRTYSGRRECRPVSDSESFRRVSPLVIIQARFQQKQLQEKEEKLLRLYEEQQERALKSVGSHSQSGGSSSVGVGKVRHMFQSRRGNSESRLGAAITGRDKSYPLEPLTKYSVARNHRFTTSRTQPAWATRSPPRQRSLSLDRNEPDPFPFGEHEESLGVETDGHSNRVRNRNEPQVGRTRDRNPGRSFRLVEDPLENRESLRRRVRNASANRPDPEERFLEDISAAKNRTTLRRDEESEDFRRKSFQTLSPRETSHFREDDSAMEGRYKSYLSQSTFARKPHLGNGALSARTGLPAKQVADPKETTSSSSSSSGYLNGNASSPVRKIRKPTPVPLSVAPSQHLLQKEMRKTPRVETIKEVPTSVSSGRSVASRASSTPGSLQKPPTPGRSLPPARVSPGKPSPAAPSGRSAPPSDLVDCRICGRHFAADRVSKHEEVCQKSSRNKRKPFDALQQRVKGTEVEQFFKKSTKPGRIQQEKAVAKPPQSNWRKKHEEFINNIRAAKEVSAHLKKGGKLSDLPPPPPSDYSDYVPCPHCGRKFNSSAAERHIPKCVNIINNKPKPGLQKSAAGLKQGSKLLHATSPSVRGRK